MASASSDIPSVFVLETNFPNPFRISTRIRYALPKPAFVELSIFDLQGRLVDTIVDDAQTAGWYEILFDGSKLPSGTYFYRLTAGTFRDTKIMQLIK